MKNYGLITALLVSLPVHADVIIGPSPPTITTTVNVSTDLTFIYGNTIIATTLLTNATNVTGSVLNLNSASGPNPGVISIQAVNGVGLRASGGSIVASGVTVQTQGGHAVLSTGLSSNVSLNGVNLSTSGTGAGMAAIGGTINATNTTINNTGTSPANVSAGHGAIAESGGTIILGSGNSITTGAINSVGLGASGVGSRVTTTSAVPVTLNGRNSMGIYLHDGGQVSLVPNSMLQLNGYGSVGITADNTVVALGTIGRGLTINLNGAPASTGSSGLVAYNGGNLSLEQVTVTGVGGAAGAWARPSSTINLSGGSILNINSNMNPTYYTLQTDHLVTEFGQVGSIFGVVGGLPIGGLLSNAGTITSDGTTINVSSVNGVGAYAGYATPTPQLSVIDFTENRITTTGDFSYGVEADSNGQITGRDSQILTSGGGSALFVSSINGPASIDLTRSTVQATGFGTLGLLSFNISPDLATVVNLTTSRLASDEGSVIEAFGGPLNLTMNDTKATATDGQLLIEAVHYDFAPQETAVHLNASNNSILYGNAQADAQSIINMNLSTNTLWTGAAFNVTNETIDTTSQWTMTESSYISQQTTNAGLIFFTPPSDAFKTLTTQNYLGSEGSIALNTYLGDDSSPSDKLIINGGSATGHSFLTITNTDGPGALTRQNGILVVDTINNGTTATQAFSLDAPVLAGPFEYRLYRSSVDSTNKNAWYLRNLCEPGNPLCSVEPVPDPPLPVPGNPEYRSEIGLYPVLPAMAILYGQALLDTLHQRVGAGTASNRIWGRVIGLHGERDRLTTKRAIRSSRYDYNFGIFQVGGDLFRKETESKKLHRAGVYGAFGRGQGDVKRPNLKLGSNQFDAFSAGGYWTIYSPIEAYVDTVLQATWYNQAQSKSYRLPALETEGWGFAASVESGYPFFFKKRWTVEPQIQAVYQAINLHDSRDIGAAIRFSDTDALTGRLGVRLAHKWDLDEQNQRTLYTWFRPNLWYQFKGTPQAQFSSAYGFIPFQAQLEGSTLELNLGTTWELPQNIALYANGSYGVGLNMHANTYDGRVGVKAMLS